MDLEPEGSQDILWEEYGQVFRDFDDMSLARWMCQTLGQVEGKAWRMSHPLVGAYRLCAELAHQRQIWFKRLANSPPAYSESTCCRAPLLPLLTRDVSREGLVCCHCSGTAIPFEDIPEPVRSRLAKWAETYGKVHDVAHWEEGRRLSCGDYENELESAAKSSEDLLKQAGVRLAPMLLEYYPAVIWEDHDECLEVRPEDIRLR